MRIILSLWLVLVFLITATPAVAAHEFVQTDNLFFNAGTNLYRQKSPERPWQLAALPSGTTVTQTVSWQNQIWLVVNTNGQEQLLRSVRPLRLSAVGAVAAADHIVLKSLPDRLLVWRTLGGVSDLVSITTGQEVQPIAPSLVNNPSDLERVVSLNGQNYYFYQSGSKTLIYRLDGNWQLWSEIDCAHSTVLTTPLIGLVCDNGAIWQLQPGGGWVELGFRLQAVYHSSSLLAGWDQTQNQLFRIYQDGRLTNLQLGSIDAGSTESIQLSGERILLKKTGGNWQELLWQVDPPQLLDLVATNSGAVILTTDPNLVLINGTTPQLSRMSGQWQLMLTQGSFDHAAPTGSGTLIWNAGSLTQFAGGQSTEFVKVNPWSSTTSPLQTLYLSPSASYISVITQSGSGNVNLYRTTNFTSWTRLTLPSQPTLSPTIAEARALPAGSLVELEGVITVGPNIVDDEVVYLEEADSGIQIYLNKSIGALPNTINQVAIATGEVSSSQTKRIILDSLAGLELENFASWNSPTITPGAVSGYLGRRVELTGSVGQLDTDSFSLSQLAASLKVHFGAAKTTLQLNDQLALKTVVDWNSASGAIEAWSLSSDFQLLGRTVTSTAASSQRPVSAVKKTTTKSSPTVSNATATAPSNRNAKETVPTLVSAEQSTSSTTDKSLPMSVVSLLAGLVSVRGRRLQRWLNR